MAMTQIRGGRTFTLVEVLIVLAVVAVLLAILIPVYHAVRERGRTAACLSNLRQLHAAFTAYAADHEDLIPPYQNQRGLRYGTAEGGPTVPIPEQGARLVASLHPYVSADALWFCPNDPFAGSTDSGDNQSRVWHRYASYITSLFTGMEQVTGESTTADGPAHMHGVRNPAASVLLTDNLWGEASLTQMRPDYSHGGGVTFNYVFFDGHAKTIRFDKN